MDFQPRHFTSDNYLQHKKRALQDPFQFWKDQAFSLLHWDRPFTKVWEGDFASGKILWFTDGVINASYNCLDRHIEKGLGDKVAFFYQSEDGKDRQQVTYSQLLKKVSNLCHIFQAQGAVQGDRVIIYMPMALEAVAVMLACARMGLVHSVVFAGFSAQALKGRIEDCRPKLICTANSFQRGGKTIALYPFVREALETLEPDRNGHGVPTVLVYPHQKSASLNLMGGDLDLGQLMDAADRKKSMASFPPALMQAEDPLFILYTSGSTGKPKGLLHTHGGYLTQVAYTFKHVFDHHPKDHYWCTADIGWITGHSYVVYGPLLLGGNSFLFEGAPSFPDWGRFWSLVDEYKINTFYTAPTAIRSFMAQGNGFIDPHNLSSLRLLGTVGEPINPAAWEWYSQTIGKNKCPIVDTWWQTETGGIMITPVAGVHQAKPGWAMEALPGIFPQVLSPQTGHPLTENSGEGALVIGTPWPGMARTIYRDHQRFVETYFKPYPGHYFTGDGCERDENGFLRITGRIDDVINVAGHRLGTAEVESALVKHPRVAEAAVVGVDDPIKGQNMVCFVRCRAPEGGKGQDIPWEKLKAELEDMVIREIGRFARPKDIFPVEDLPKTRSGKIMRRILRKIASGEGDQLGDLSTLASPELVTQLKKLSQSFSRS